MKAGMRSAGCWPSESMVSTWVKPAACGGLQAVQHGRTLALFARQHQDPEPGSVACQLAQALGRAVGAAVDHDPHRRPLAAGGGTVS